MPMNEENNDDQQSYSPPPMLEREDWQNEFDEEDGDDDDDEEYQPNEDFVDEPAQLEQHPHEDVPEIERHNGQGSANDIEDDGDDEEYDSDQEKSKDDEGSVYSNSEKSSSDSEEYIYRSPRRHVEDKENELRTRRPRITDPPPQVVQQNPSTVDEEEDLSNVVFGPNHNSRLEDHLPRSIINYLYSDLSSWMDTPPSAYEGVYGPSTSQGKSSEPIPKRPRVKSLDITDEDWKNVDPYMFDDILRCSVCNDIVQWNILLTCDHLFCSSCLTGEEDTCPKCNATIESARHDKTIEHLLPKLKVDQLRQKPYRPKIENPFAIYETPLYPSPEQQAASRPARFHSPEPLYKSLPRVDVVEFSEEELKIKKWLNYGECEPSEEMSEDIDSLFEKNTIMRLSRHGCPVILRPRNIQMNVKRRTMHLIIPETSSIGHLEEYVRRTINRKLSFAERSKMQISFRRILYSKIRNDIEISNKKGSIQSPGKHKEPMLVYAQKIGEPRLHNLWTLNEYRVYHKIKRTATLEFTYDIKPITRNQNRSAKKSRKLSN